MPPAAPIFYVTVWAKKLRELSTTRSSSWPHRSVEKGQMTHQNEKPRVKPGESAQTPRPEHEGKLISDRTRSALAAAKARGKRLGGYRGRPGTSADCAKARQARSATADARAADLAPVIDDIKETGAKSLNEIARELNARDISAPRGGQWSAAQARLLVRRLQSLGRHRTFD